MEVPLTTSTFLITFLNDENTSENSANISENYSSYYIQEEQIGRLIALVCYPVIIIIGTVGNILTFFVMQRGSLKSSSTCFYMADAVTKRHK